MSDKEEKKLYREAFEEVEKEILDEKIKEVKGYIHETLQKIEEKKQEKEKVEEELRILKLDLEDLRNGKFDKMIERQSKSQASKRVSVHIPTNIYIEINKIEKVRPFNWLEITSGTYTIPLSAGNSFSTNANINSSYTTSNIGTLTALNTGGIEVKSATQNGVTSKNYYL